MSVEKITIAICAPSGTSSRSFTCGKFHLVINQGFGVGRALDTQVDAFEQVLATAKTDISEIKKITCMQCFTQEFERFQRPEPVQSPGLQSVSVTTNDLEARDTPDFQHDEDSGNGDLDLQHATSVFDQPGAEAPTFAAEDTLSTPAVPEPEHEGEQFAQISTHENPIESPPSGIENGSSIFDKTKAWNIENAVMPEAEKASDNALQIESRLETNAEAPNLSLEEPTEPAQISKPSRLLVPVPKITPEVREAVRQFGGARAFLTSRA